MTELLQDLELNVMVGRYAIMYIIDSCSINEIEAGKFLTPHVHSSLSCERRVNEYIFTVIHGR